MGAIYAAVPVWVWLILAALVGALLVLAWPAAVDAWWALVDWGTRVCLIVGVSVVAVGVVGVLLLLTGVVDPPRLP